MTRNMRVPGLDQVLQHLRETPNARLGKGADDREVAEVERELGVNLPPSYRTFVRRIGWASTGGISVFGLGSGVPPDIDLRRVMEWRKDLPGRAVPFARDAAGAIYCLDASHSGPYESPVYRCEPGARGDKAMQYEGHNFASWLWRRLAEARAE